MTKHNQKNKILGGSLIIFEEQLTLDKAILNISHLLLCSLFAVFHFLSKFTH